MANVVARGGTPLGGPGRHVTRATTGAGLGAAVLALFSASCCVLPAAFMVAGLGGPWLANLDLFLTYRLEIQFVSMAAVATGWGVFLMRRHRLAMACRAGLCQHRGSAWPGAIALGIATVLVAGSWVVWSFQDPIRLWIFAFRG